MSHDLFSSSSFSPASSFGSPSFSSTPACELFASGGLLVREETGGYRLAEAREVLDAAQRLLLSQVRGQQMMETPQMVRDFLMLRLGGLEYEVFAVLHLNAQHCVIDYAEMFRGTLTQTSVYPREIVRESLVRNTASVVLVHNHPSGIAKPSRADEALTQTLKAALALVDVRVLDHFVVAGPTLVSMAELGLL